MARVRVPPGGHPRRPHRLNGQDEGERHRRSGGEEVGPGHQRGEEEGDGEGVVGLAAHHPRGPAVGARGVGGGGGEGGTTLSPP